MKTFNLNLKVVLICLEIIKLVQFAMNLSSIYWSLQKVKAVVMIALMYFAFPSYNVFLLLNQLIVKRISKKLYFELNDKLYECYHKLFLFYLDLFSGIQVKIRKPRID